MKKTIPFVRIEELRALPNAELLAYTLGKGLFDDCKVTTYKSRQALEAFCKDGSSHHAVIKTPTHPSMITNRNTQRPA